MYARPAGTATGEWKAHWRAAVAVSIGLASGYSAFQFSASQFIAPWQTQFGWSRGEIALAQYGSLLAAVLSPWAGGLLDRVGTRRPIIIAMALTGFGYLAMAAMGGSLAQYYGMFLFVQLVGMMTTSLSFTRVIVARFHASRGKALAFSRVGVAIFGMLVPALVHAVIAALGWREAFVLLAAITLLIGCPICWWGIHDLPVGRTGAVAKTRPSLIALLRRQPKIIVVCVTAGLHYAPIGALLSQLQPLLVSKQVGGAEAAALGGVFAGATLAGAVISGVFVDRVWAPLVGCLFALGPFAGCLILLHDVPAWWSVVLAVILIGASQGAEIDVMAYVTARYFGLGSFSAIYGLVMMTTIVFAFASQVAIGFAFDHFGNYQNALIVGVFLFALTAALYLSLGRYPAASPPFPNHG